jgi:hypothetical protein
MARAPPTRAALSLDLSYLIFLLIFRIWAAVKS